VTVAGGRAPRSENRLRSSTKWNTRYPQWREVLPSLSVTDLHSALCMEVRDATRQGKDVVIGDAVLPLSHLWDQCSHTFWIRVREPMIVAPEARSRPHMKSDCALKITVRLNYSRISFWSGKIEEIREKIREMKRCHAEAVGGDFDEEEEEREEEEEEERRERQEKKEEGEKRKEKYRKREISESVKEREEKKIIPSGESYEAIEMKRRSLRREREREREVKYEINNNKREARGEAQHTSRAREHEESSITPDVTPGSDLDMEGLTLASESVTKSLSGVQERERERERVLLLFFNS